jgi:hypothetical protein
MDALQVSRIILLVVFDYIILKLEVAGESEMISRIANKLGGAGEKQIPHCQMV